MSTSLFVVEARDAEGNLVQDKDKQPPWSTASENQLFAYFCEHKGAGGYTRDDMVQWYQSHGWYIRPRSW